MLDAELLRWTITIAVPALAGLSGVAIGAWLTARRERKQRQLQFVSNQLQHFYSPLLGIRAEIRTRSVLRQKISGAANSAWHSLCDEARDRGGPEALRDLTDSRAEQFKAIIEYNNRQLAEELIPAYRRMVGVFRDNLWLAEPETRSYFAELVEFVEVWERWLKKSLPGEVVELLEHDEARLDLLYQHLEQQHELLRAALVAGEPRGRLPNPAYRTLGT